MHVYRLAEEVSSERQINVNLVLINTYGPFCEGQFTGVNKTGANSILTLSLRQKRSTTCILMPMQ